MDEEPLALLRMLIARLERISADSYWAHRASGIRGTLLKMLDDLESGKTVSGIELRLVTNQGYEVLLSAIKDLTKFKYNRNNHFHPH
ncbi:MAG: hypothetical protein IH589_16520 [Anaerolineales bacterium]|nr:hypothetical protein [Anaerolineales bacterium]